MQLDSTVQPNDSRSHAQSRAQLIAYTIRTGPILDTKGSKSDGWYTGAPCRFIMTNRPTSDDNAYTRIQRGWPIILMAGILGGLIGLAIGSSLPPRYEAIAAVRIAIDHSRTLPLDEREERQALNRVLDLILSDATLERAVQLAPQTAKADAGITSAATLREVIRLRDLRGRWELVATGSNPQAAIDMADAWATSAIENAEISIEHARRASELQDQVLGLGCELRESTSEIEGAVWECGLASDEDLADEVVESLMKALELSRGLMPALSVSHLESAAAPSGPVSNARAVYALVGSIAGLVVGTLTAALWPYVDRSGKSQTVA